MPNRDFIGHIGGDDFMILFQSEDWETRCQAMLDDFAAAILAFYSMDDCDAAAISAKTGRGKKCFIH